jgi:integrase
VARTVKRYAEAAGLDPAEFPGHSLRAGFATSAAETGASILKIMETTRHRSVDVLAAYVRRSISSRTTRGRRSCECT